MNKNTLYIVLGVVVVIIAGLVFWGNSGSGTPIMQPPVQTPTSTVQTSTSSPAAFDPKNATYTIDGNPVTLINGTNSSTSIFGQPVSGDLNGDGVADAVVIIKQNPGGSGTFYYVAAALNTASGTQGTNAILLGDRIAPQNAQIVSGQIVANYADRKPGEPMTAKPSVGVTKKLTVNGTVLVAAAPVAGPGARCGGNMTTAPVCQTGYHCAPAAGSHLPFGDVGGMCVKN